MSFSDNFIKWEYFLVSYIRGGKKLKRLISCILVVCILASMLVTTAVAGPSDPLTLTDTVILNDT